MDIGFRGGGLTGLRTVYEFNNTEFSWFDKLREEDPLFVELLKERWNDPEDGMNVKLQELTREGGVLDAYSDELCASWLADYDTWKFDDETVTPEDFEERIEKLRTWIEKRRLWIGEHLDQIDNTRITVNYEVDGQVIETRSLRANHIPEDAPDAPEKEGFIFVGWKDKETGEDHGEHELMQDTVFSAKYLDEAESHAKAVFFAHDEIWVDIIMSAVYSFDNWYGTVSPEAIVREEVWESSNEDVATIEDDTVAVVGV